MDANYPIDFNELFTNITDLFRFIGLFKDWHEILFEDLHNCDKVSEFNNKKVFNNIIFEP